MREFKLGDKVKVLHETVQGLVIEVLKSQITILDDDGFERSYRPIDLVHAASPEKYASSDVDTDVTKTKNSIFQQKSTSKTSAKEQEPVIDLHIEELIDDHRGLGNSEILAIQMRHCRNFVEKAITKRIRKIAIVHGKGEGVLRLAVHDYLNKLRFEQDINLRYDDAAENIYGLGGSTVVVFGR